jgi:hypothetical protein
MSYKDVFSRFEPARIFHTHNALSSDTEAKPEPALSPRNSDRPEQLFFKTMDRVPHTSTLKPQKSSEHIPKEPQTAPAVRKFSAVKPVALPKQPKIEDILKENQELKSKLEIVQRERDLIKLWKKVSPNNEAKAYQEKLSILVRNIKQFLDSTSKFQSVLREKMGQSFGNAYEEERSLLKQQLFTTAQEFELPFKYSPIGSPIRGNKSPQLERQKTVTEARKFSLQNKRKSEIRLGGKPPSTNLSQNETDELTNNKRVNLAEELKRKNMELEELKEMHDKDIEILQEELISLRSENAEVKDLEQEVARKNKEIRELGAVIRGLNAKADEIAKKMEEKEKMNKESLERIERNYNETVIKVNKKAQKVIEFRAKAQGLAQDVDFLKEQLASAIKEKDKYTQTNKEEFVKLTNEILQSEEIIQKQRQEVSGLKSEIARFRVVEQEMQKK